MASFLDSLYRTDSNDYEAADSGWAAADVAAGQRRIGARSEGDYDRLVESVLAHLPGCDAVVLSDYAKGVLTPEVCRAIIQAARALDIPVLVDPKTADFSRYRGATT